jgi:hypothetical protein
MILTNKNQRKIVKEIHQKIKEKVISCEFTDLSATFFPYYDSILSEDNKSNLEEIKMTPICFGKVKGLGLQSFMKVDKR